MFGTDPAIVEYMNRHLDLQRQISKYLEIMLDKTSQQLYQIESHLKDFKNFGIPGGETAISRDLARKLKIKATSGSTIHLDEMLGEVLEPMITELQHISSRLESLEERSVRPEEPLYYVLNEILTELRHISARLERPE